LATEFTVDTMRQRGRFAPRPKIVRSPKALRLESLEARLAPSATAVSAALSAGWFGDYLTSAEPSHAGPATITAQGTGVVGPSVAAVTANEYDWIVQFNLTDLGGITSAAQTASLLAGEGVQFGVLLGLGQTGEVLARSYGTSAAAASAALQADRDVASFEMDSVQQFAVAPVTANNPSFSQQWSLNNTGQSGGTAGDDIHATQAWSISTGSQNVVVAVVDTGIDYTDPDLAANIWNNPYAGTDGFSGDIHGYNFVADDGNPMDDNGHGTHVAGIIGATGENGQGTLGVDPNVSLMALKFLDANGSGYTSDAIRAINYATMMRTQYNVNVRVINASWSGGTADPALSAAIQAAGNAGILFVAAAGNSGTNNDSLPQYPSSYSLPNVLSVAASDPNDQLASFSCYGASTVNLAAPGVGIYSTLPGNTYGTLSGTSMATPEVAGVAALAWAAAPNDTVAQIRSAILQGVDQVSALAGKVSSGGRLDAYNTLRIVTQSQSTTPVIASLIANPSAISAGGTVALSAQGVSEQGGAIAGVYFYQDTDNGAAWDASDRLLGSTASVTSGQASFAMSTAGMSAGTYEIFARAEDAKGQWSAAAGTQLTVTAALNHGTNAATAAAVGVGTTVNGTLYTFDDAAWYKFQAVAGQGYCFQTVLGTLHDSVLTLYAGDGLTVLSRNDDIAPGNLASKITWQAPAAGTYYVAVTSYPCSGPGTFALQSSTVATAPLLAPVANQSVAAGASLAVSLSAQSCAGGQVTYAAQAYTADPTAQLAYTLSQQLGLSATTAYKTNAHGWQEKYLVGSGGTVYFIVPSGTLYQLTNTTSLAKNKVVGQFNLTYYTRPTLLSSATPPAMALATASTIGVSVSGNVLTLRPSAAFSGTAEVIATARNSVGTVTQTFNVVVNVPAASSTQAAQSIETAPAAAPAVAPVVLPPTAAAAAIVDRVIASASWNNESPAQRLLDLTLLNAFYLALGQ
jgi:subtilisin family serine protease